MTNLDKIANQIDRFHLNPKLLETLNDSRRESFPVA